MNVIGYTAWSLMDSFEWTQGYTERFGLHWVDFDDPGRQRKPKQSVACFSEIISRSFPEDGLKSCERFVADTTTPAPTTSARSNFIYYF